MEAFICKAKKMTDEELHSYITSLSGEEVRRMFKELLAHHIEESEEMEEEIEDLREDKKAYREILKLKK